MGPSVRFVVQNLLMAILPVLTLSGADSDNSRLFKEVKINGGEASCSTEGKNYKSVTLSSELTSPRIPCSTICNMDDACVLFDTQGNICNMYTLTLSAVTPCASGDAGTRAYTKVLGVDIALHTSVQYSSTVDDHVVPFSELTSDRTTYPDYHYCPCTLEQANSWIRVDLGRRRKISRVDLTASLQLRETHFRTVNIHIGETGDWQNDPIVGGKDAKTPGELEVLKFDVAGIGRYLTLVQQETDYFCICKIQAYGY